MTSQNTSRDDFDRLIAQWMEAEALVREPEHLLDSVLAQTRGTRRLPGWLLPERWIPVQLTMPLRVVPRLAPVLLLIALLLAAIVAIVLVGSRPRLPDPFGPAANGRVLYLSNGQVFGANGDGSNPVQLTFDSRAASWPVWSRDGTRFAYKLLSTWSTAEDPEVFGDLVVVDADGKNPITIERDTKGMSGTEWSPDGRWLLYSRYVEGLEQVFVAPADGSSPPARVGKPDTVNSGPVFSPDGTKIAYLEAQRGVVVMNRDGSNPQTLNQTAFKHLDNSLAWHPDGNRIVVGAAIGEEAFDLWFLDLDGGAEKHVEVAGRAEVSPSWSPDGKRLLYLTTTDGRYWLLRVADADGKQERLLLGVYNWVPPTWSPDGTRIAAVDAISTVARIRILDPDDEEEPVEIDGVLPSASIIAPRSGIPTWQRKASP